MDEGIWHGYIWFMKYSMQGFGTRSSGVLEQLLDSLCCFYDFHRQSFVTLQVMLRI